MAERERDAARAELAEAHRVNEQYRERRLADEARAERACDAQLAAERERDALRSELGMAHIACERAAAPDSNEHGAPLDVPGRIDCLAARGGEAVRERDVLRERLASFAAEVIAFLHDTRDASEKQAAAAKEVESRKLWLMSSQTCHTLAAAVKKRAREVGALAGDGGESDTSRWETERCRCGTFHHAYAPRPDATCSECGEGESDRAHGACEGGREG